MRALSFKTIFKSLFLLIVGSFVLETAFGIAVYADSRAYCLNHLHNKVPKGLGKTEWTEDNINDFFLACHHQGIMGQAEVVISPINKFFAKEGLIRAEEKCLAEMTEYKWGNCVPDEKRQIQEQ